MKKILLILFAVSFGCYGSLMAQERIVSGTVVDDVSDAPLPGVNVVLKGTSTGTVTDINGNYRVTVPGDDAVLLFTYVGYETKEVPVGARSIIDVSMGQDVTQLAEIVVVGYGTQEKKEITSAVASVTPEEFNNGNVTSATGLLQGKVAGLSIVRPGGDPNQGFNIRLRGLTTFGANSQPLIVIDGVVGASLESVDPNDVASFDVLKDGSGAAIYGARGSSGVILITTKSGRGADGEAIVSVNTFVTVDEVANTIDVLSPEKFVEVGGQDFGSQTDWFDELTGTGVSYTTNVSIGGSLGTNTSYRGAVNYRDNQGIVEGVKFDRLNTRLNITHNALDDRLRLTANLAHNNRDQESINMAAFKYAVVYNPTAPIFDDENTIEDGGYFQRDLFDFYNPVALRDQQLYLNERRNTLLNLKAEYEIIDNLTLGLNYGLDRETGMSGAYATKSDYVSGRGANGWANRTTYDRLTTLFEGTVNYNTRIGDDLEVNALLGGSRQEFDNEGFGVQVRQFLFDQTTFNNLGFGSLRQGNDTWVSSDKSIAQLNSYFSRVNLNFDNRYFLSASVRREAYSGFGENEKAGYFPAISAGTMLSDIFDLGPVNMLKLRVSYGVTGNLPPNPTLALPLSTPGNRIDLDGDPQTTDDIFVAPVQSRDPNPSLKWETKKEFDIGFDFEMLNNRLSGTFDYYQRNIEDLLFGIQTPRGAPNPFDEAAPANVVGFAWANIADLSAAGVEFALAYNNISLGPVLWTPSVNFTYYDKTVIDNFSVGDLGLAEIRLATPGSPGQNQNEIIRNKVGETIGNMYGPEFLGIDENGEYVLSSENPEDWGVIGNGLPDGEFGFSNTFVYGNFDLNFFLRGVFGHDLYNSYRGFYEPLDATSSTWNSVITDKTDPRITATPTFSSLYVEDASFIRLDNAQLGYNLQLDGEYLQKVRIYLAGQNLFTITDYTGIDPEVRYTDAENSDSFTSGLAPGIERRNTYFTTRSFTLGVNFNLK